MKFESGEEIVNGEESGEEKSEKMRGTCGELCDWDRERRVFIVFLLKDVKRLSNSFLIERCECQWLRERETCGEEKSKKCSSIYKWKDKKTFIVSWFFHLKP